MKSEFCIVNNETSHLEELTRMTAVYGSCKVKRPEEVRVGDNYTAMILSGSSTINFMDYFAQYPHMKEVIQQVTIPTLGICLGFQLIACLYDAPLQRMNEKVQGIVEIHPHGKNILMTGLEHPQVYEGHRWIAPSVGQVNGMLPLADSEHGVEIFQVKDKPVFGFQFHPEVVEYNGVKTSGHQLFENFLRASNVI